MFKFFNKRVAGFLSISMGFLSLITTIFIPYLAYTGKILSIFSEKITTGYFITTIIFILITFYISYLGFKSFKNNKFLYYNSIFILSQVMLSLLDIIFHVTYPQKYIDFYLSTEIILISIIFSLISCVSYFINGFYLLRGIKYPNFRNIRNVSWKLILFSVILFILSIVVVIMDLIMRSNLEKLMEFPPNNQVLFNEYLNFSYTLFSVGWILFLISGVLVLIFSFIIQLSDRK